MRASAAGATPFRLSNPRAGSQIDEQTFRTTRHCKRSEAISGRERVGFRRPEIATRCALAMTAGCGCAPAPFRLSNPRAGSPMDEQTLRTTRHCERSEAISGCEKVGFWRPEIATRCALAMTARCGCAPARQEPRPSGSRILGQEARWMSRHFGALQCSRDLGQDGRWSSKNETLTTTQKGPMGPLKWWREWDSNPRATRVAAGFQDRCIQPLCHLSGKRARSVALGGQC
jgi:hypothetical protein